MHKLKDDIEHLIHFIDNISDTAQDTGREKWKNEYANMHSLMRLDNVNRLCYELLDRYKNHGLPVIKEDFDKLFSNVGQFVDYLNKLGTPLKDAYGLGELFVYMTENLNVEEQPISDIEYFESLYLKANQLAGKSDAPTFYRNTENVQAMLDSVISALTHSRLLKLIYSENIADLPNYVEVAQHALSDLISAPASKQIDSYPYLNAYINLVNIAYYSRRLKEVDLESVIHELELMQIRIQQYLNESMREVYIDSLPATPVVPKKEDTTFKKENTGISLDFFKRD